MDREGESLQAPDRKKYYPVFRWEGNDLILDNTDTFLDQSRDRQRPKVLFGPKLVKTMDWVTEEIYDDCYLTTNLVKVFENDVVPTGFKKDWTNDNTFRTNNFWNLTDEGALQLSPYCNWRFNYLDEAYSKVCNSGSVTPDFPHRSPMYLYSNVGRSTITGNRVTDLLREVPHDPTKITYEPCQIQYKPVRSNLLDIVETQVVENDGKLVNFTSGVTSVTLHFKDE